MYITVIFSGQTFSFVDCIVSRVTDDERSHVSETGDQEDAEDI